MNQTLEDTKKLAEEVIARKATFTSHGQTLATNCLKLITDLELSQKQVDILCDGMAVLKEQLAAAKDENLKLKEEIQSLHELAAEESI